ncbi:hypothetical protein ELG78_09160 [Rhizobium leguminosarum]|uniref:hypothetical protein n=1 Tax=Rhizobium leguminosarum TaxID=384 RepID=UPI0010301526|nr:hypothetical protein [Rhizobium leguminosarum]TBG37137.1 hypothetical protein ELG78_09160 [Rhizobium leguminosarum]
MKILSLLSKLWQAERPKPPTVSQVGVQARAIRHLIARGTIDARTVFLMGTTDAHKMFTRMRRMGLLFDANDPNGHTLVTNKSGSGQFRRHKWTGKLPAGWADLKPCPVAGQAERRPRIANTK